MVPFWNREPGSAWRLAHWLGISDFATVPADELEVVRATGVKEVDGRGGPVSEDDGALFLTHSWRHAECRCHNHSRGHRAGAGVHRRWEG